MPIEGPKPNLSKVRAISFDLDDTLWDCAPAIANAERALFDWHTHVTPRITKAHSPDALQNIRLEFRKTNPALSGCVTAMRIAGLRHLLTSFEYPESLAEEGFAVFYKARSQVTLYPGTQEVLTKLSSSFRLAAITNGNADLQSIGISRYFDKIYAANLTLLEKPAPDMFNLCFQEMGISACDLLHVGDNPITDVVGAHEAGAQTVWFNQYNSDWPVDLNPPDFVVNTLSDVVALFQR